MPRKKKATPQTLVAFVLDESGSMQPVKPATISGFNEYIDTLKRQPGENLFTLTTFGGTDIKHIFAASSVQNVGHIDDMYQPAGSTPLYDAIGKTIAETDKAIETMKVKPSVLMMIMTDGQENSSKEFNRERIFDLISKKQKEGWTFGYMGADQDAWSVGASIGVPQDNAVAYAAADPGSVMRRMGRATENYMVSGSVQSRSLFDNTDDKVK